MAVAYHKKWQQRILLPVTVKFYGAAAAAALNLCCWPDCRGSGIREDHPGIVLTAALVVVVVAVVATAAAVLMVKGEF